MRWRERVKQLNIRGHLMYYKKQNQNQGHNLYIIFLEFIHILLHNINGGNKKNKLFLSKNALPIL